MSRSVLITGGNRGIGLAIARHYLPDLKIEARGLSSPQLGYWYFDLLQVHYKDRPLLESRKLTLQLDMQRLWRNQIHIPELSAQSFLFDNTLIESTLAGGDPKWANYEMPLVSEDPQLWAMGIRLADMNAPFGEFLKKLSVDWHKSGKLIELEKKWGIKQNPFLVDMNKKLKGS